MLNMKGTSADLRARSRDKPGTTIENPDASFRHLMDGAPFMVWVSGADKLCTWFNKPWLDFTGRTMEQERGNGWAEGVHSEDLDGCLRIYTSHFDQRIPFRMEYRLRRADGEYRWLLDTGVPRFTNDGVFEGYMGSCIDINAIKNAQTVAHELGNLLCSFLTSLWFINKDADDPSAVRRLAKEAEKLAIKDTKIIERLLEKKRGRSQAPPSTP
jgi:PAS domain S-box-containing protein